MDSQGLKVSGQDMPRVAVGGWRGLGAWGSAPTGQAVVTCYARCPVWLGVPLPWGAGL